ncbi:thiaminase II [Fictibacillus phosphorivorans]|uniref:thiaminase II n=1 Tax=Fictibacillus phosphorivorans TaxID=1221500 RepID=UPI00203FC4A4|nr:thiaminase II [Fictibacillus phosphorivorans]MCM3719342.1 thiaminase II [Fictibacillus phosphorivorans]MCM3776963.1 thiaminase II [Fictibacillus phosphorivorans]
MSIFTEELRKQAEPIWEANLTHPFVRGIAEGTLPLENFKYYVLQDSYYLSHFARIQAYGAARAEDLYTTSRMAAHAQGTNEAELTLHEKFIKQLHISEEELAEFEPAPTAYNYTSHLYRVAESGSLGEIIAAILPCYWIYHEIGERFEGANPTEPIYQEWITAYGGEWFSQLVQEQISRLDELADKVSHDERNKMIKHFLLSCQYEYLFWEMAFSLETWPVPTQQLKLKGRKENV